MTVSFSIRWKTSAQRDVRKLEKHTTRKVVDAVAKLAACPLPSGARKIIGSENSYRVRVGDYRVIYAVLANEVVIEIIRVRHRKDVYRGF